MINGWILNLMRNRTWRHVLFWVCWIAGFTFVKSFGETLEVYFGWFSYYVVTLPIFMAQTYLVAYQLIPRFMNKKYFMIFILLFMGLFYGFSVLELVVSNEFIFKWYPTGSKVLENYLSPKNVIVSGMGNLYIVLVFLATRTVRDWYLADNKQKELQQVELQQQIEDAMTKVQPMLLLYAIDNIERMVASSSKEVTDAIALTSELLSEVMIYREEKHQMFSREIDLVRKLVSLVELFRESKPEVEFFISGDPGHVNLPPMVLFSFVEMIFRKFGNEQKLPEVNIEASGFSNLVTVQVLNGGMKGQELELEKCLNAVSQLESYYKGGVSISCETHSYGCSVIFTDDQQDHEKTIHRPTVAVDMVRTAGS